MERFDINLIKKKMNAKGYTDTSFAKELGVTKQAVGRWMHGDSPPSIHNLSIMADVLGCKISDFFKGVTDA